MGGSVRGVVGRLGGISKKFGSQIVLDNITLEVRAGEVTALLGPMGRVKRQRLAC